MLSTPTSIMVEKAVHSLQKNCNHEHERENVTWKSCWIACTSAWPNRTALCLDKHFIAWSSDVAQDMTGQTASNHSRNFLAAAAPPMMCSNCCRGISARPAKLDAAFIKGRKLASVTPGMRRSTSTAVVLITASAAPSGAPSPSNGTPANSVSLLPNIGQAQHLETKQLHDIQHGTTGHLLR